MRTHLPALLLLMLPLPVLPPLAAAPSTACALCHRAIYESYRRTPMALSSGKAGPEAAVERFDKAAFTHQASGFRYEVERREGGVLWVDFAQSGGGPRLGGEKPMPYFAGSGAAARSYLLSSGGFLFVAPVAWYSGEGGHWGLNPSYDGYGYPFLTRPALPGCLTCHASFLKPVAGTQNRFADPPFEEGGVACERCHGPGEAHIAGQGKGGIVNPVKLEPARRDSVCAQCHLTGEVRVMKPGADWQSYHPGDRLADSMTVFVNRQPRRTVTSHVENLAQSMCKQKAGDRLWCGSCHDPHAVPDAAERISYYRSKCLACHVGASNFRAHGDDCVACHMPKGAVSDAEHVVYTDHAIPRLPRAAVRTAPAASRTELKAFGGTGVTARDTALAYAIVAGRRPELRDRARALLEASLAQSPRDAEALLYLAEIYRNSGLDARALPLYLRAAALDPAQVTASAGLGAIAFQRGDLAAAVRYWQDALGKSPGLVLVATNLAMAQWKLGDRAAAITTLRQVVELSPGFQPAAELLQQLTGP